MSTVLVPSSEPTSGASYQGTPIRYASGASGAPRIRPSVSSPWPNKPPTADAAVDHAHQRHERDQHRAHVERQLQPLAGAARRRVDDVDVDARDVDARPAPEVSGVPVSGTMILANITAAGALMNDAVTR